MDAAPGNTLACIRFTKQDFWKRLLLIIKQLEEHGLIEFASSLETKQTWVKKLREVVQETYFGTALNSLAKTPVSHSNRSSRDMDESMDEERGSLTSFGSSNTTDSEKVGFPRCWLDMVHTYWIDRGQLEKRQKSYRMSHV
ncbi:TRIO [Cordylochernes scorpioides]|uniref:TRIO n=1 Tax=Cordylochernes scorpioides TaxID=51811 RepID=A0ABY6L4T8_9ARAC|nr:TRIO [Cordylochernes scorpioides]